MKIREWLKENRITAQELAQRAGISNVTLSRILTGKITPTYQTAQALAGATGLSLQDVFERGPERAA